MKKRTTIGKLVKTKEFDKMTIDAGIVDKKSAKSCYINFTTYFINKTGDPRCNIKLLKYNFKKTIQESIKELGNINNEYIMDFVIPETYEKNKYGLINIELNFFFLDKEKIDLPTTVLGISRRINDYFNSIDYIEIKKK